MYGIKQEFWKEQPEEGRCTLPWRPGCFSWLLQGSYMTYSKWLRQIKSSYFSLFSGFLAWDFHLQAVNAYSFLPSQSFSHPVTVIPHFPVLLAPFLSHFLFPVPVFLKKSTFQPPILAAWSTPLCCPGPIPSL